LNATGGGESDLTRTWTARGTLATSTDGNDTTSFAFDAFERLGQVTAPGYQTTIARQASHAGSTWSRYPSRNKPS
jgi:hypothetical protein